MSTREHRASDVIRALKAHFGVESDDALASQIGVAKSTVATWRRRGTIPFKAASYLESEFGLKLSDLGENGKEDLRAYLLRQAFYYILIRILQNNYGEGHAERDDALLADDCAVIEPFLKRAVIRAASAVGYEGVRGASTLVLDLRSDPLRAVALMQEAIEDRKLALGVEDKSSAPTNSPTNP